MNTPGPGERRALPVAGIGARRSAGRGGPGKGRLAVVDRRDDDLRDPDAEVVDVVRSVAVQASLLSAGSLSPEIGGTSADGRRSAPVSPAGGSPRAQGQADLLPVGLCTLIDLSLAAHTRSPADSLTLAASREAIADPPPIFGMIRPRQLRPADERTTAGSAAQHAPLRQREEDWRELDDAGDSDGPVVDRFSSPVGGGGALGRLLKKFAGDARSGRSGSPGADAATRWSRSSNRVAATSVMSSATTPVADGAGGVERLGTTYPEWDVFRRRYRPEWCTVIEVDEERANRARSNCRTPTRCGGLWRVWAWPSSVSTGSCKATTSTSTPRSRRSSSRSRAPRRTKRSTSTASAPAAISACSCCSTSQARPASPGRSARPCTSTSELLRSRSPSRSTISATASPSTRSAPGVAQRSSSFP